MKIENLSDLERIVSLCRKKGIDSIEIDGIKLSLGSEPTKRPYTRKGTAASQPDSPEHIPTYNDIQTLFWSSGGIPPEGN